MCVRVSGQMTYEFRPLKNDFYKEYLHYSMQTLKAILLMLKEEFFLSLGFYFRLPIDAKYITNRSSLSNPIAWSAKSSSNAAIAHTPQSIASANK